MIKRLFLDAGRCLFCGSCSLACAVAHSGGRDLKGYLAEAMIRPGRISISRSGAGLEADFCRSCSYPQCVETCITGAMSLDGDRAVYIGEKCAACWSCVLGCPFGAVKEDPSGKSVLRCDGCGDWADPACIKACPTGALTLESPHKHSQSRRRAFSTTAFNPFGAG